VHPDAAQSVGGQVWPLEIADARQHQPATRIRQREFATAGAVVREHRRDRSGLPCLGRVMEAQFACAKPAARYG